MQKVFIIHGLGGNPNGGWRPWLMGKLGKKDIYAAALSMPSPEKPVCTEWVKEISRHIERNAADEIYLIGHSLGVPAILRYLEAAPKKIHLAGVILVSGRAKKLKEKRLSDFLQKPFDFAKIKTKTKQFLIIHGDNDTVVPFENAEFLSKALDTPLVVVKNGGHLNGSSGWYTLSHCLTGLLAMMKQKQ